MTMLSELVDVVIGVDTHKHTHTAGIIDAGTGAQLGDRTVSTDPCGYGELIEFADTCDGVRVWAIEGTGGYGAGLARHLQAMGEWVIELDRPERPARRHGAKSDPLDAYRAARESLSRVTLASPRAPGSRVALSVRLAARRSAIEAATIAKRQLNALVIAAPEQLRCRLRGHSIQTMIPIAARLRGHESWDTETLETSSVLRALAKRIITLESEAADHERALATTIKSWRPDLLELCGVGPINAATVLCAWSHPGRIHSDAAFAMLAGAAPIPASSGQTVRYRLNRSGDRQLNRALHNIAVCRLRYDPTTRAYAERRRTDGKTDREIRRCLKRYIARQLFRQLERPLDNP
jgi:transposase